MGDSKVEQAFACAMCRCRFIAGRAMTWSGSSRIAEHSRVQDSR